MRIGNGPRLVVPRGVPTRRRWGYYSRDYEQHLAEQWARIRRARHNTAGDVKQPAVWLADLKPGEHYRHVDGHGRSIGPRIAATAYDRFRISSPKVRRVDRQPEDYHSQLSRMLKRTHKLAIRED